MKKKIIFILLVCLVASGILTRMPLSKGATPAVVIKRAQTIKGFSRRNEYLMKQARRLFSAKDFEGAILVATELTVGTNKYTIEANVLTIKAEQALQVQQELEARKAREAIKKAPETEENRNGVDNSK